MVTPDRPTGLVSMLVVMALHVIPGRSVRRLRPNGENIMSGSLLLPAGLLVVMALFILTSFAVSASSSAPRRGKTDVATVALRVAIYMRYSSQHQSPTSILDQKRNIVKRLEELKIDCSNVIELFDKGVSGERMDRKDFKRLVRMVERKELDVVAVDDFGRLTKGLDFALLLAKMKSRRCRFVTVIDAIDSNVNGYELKALLQGVLNHVGNRAHGERTKRGTKGNVLDGNTSYGGQCYAYTSVPYDPEAAAKYMGAGPKPKKYNVIVEAERVIVVEVFTRYAKGDLASEIAADLNRRQVPLGRRSVPKNVESEGRVKWRGDRIRDMLQQRKYIGDWSYGATYVERDENGKPKRLPADPDQSTPSFRPDLRIISDELWDKCQAKLKANWEKYAPKEEQQEGVKKAPLSEDYPKDLLSGLLYCGYPGCGCRMTYIDAGGGPSYQCPVAASRSLLPTGEPCKNNGLFDRAKVTEKLVDYIGTGLKAYPEWIETVYGELVDEYKRCHAAAPDELKLLQDKLREVAGKIAHLTDSLENGEAANVSPVVERLKQREREKVALESDIRRLKAGQKKVDALPDMDWVRKQLKSLLGVFNKEPRRSAFLFRAYFNRVKACTLLEPGDIRGPKELRFRPSWQRLVKEVMAVEDALDVENDAPEPVNDNQPEERISLGGMFKLYWLRPEIEKRLARGETSSKICADLKISEGSVQRVRTQRKLSLAKAAAEDQGSAGDSSDAPPVVDTPAATDTGNPVEGVEGDSTIASAPIQPGTGENELAS